MAKTSIEWTGFSVNPVQARLVVDGKRVEAAAGHYCEKVSPGCKNCYSSRQQPRFRMPQFQEQRKRDDVEIFLDVSKLQQVLDRKTPTTWFWESMSDLFGDWVPNEWIAACFGVMAATPQHTHQVLTKRAERLPEWFEWVDNQGAELLGQVNETPPGGSPVPAACAISANLQNQLEIISGDHWRAAMKAPWPLPNVHLGVSCEDQQRADERIPHLLRTPAAVRWVSAEPLLGPIDFGEKGLGQGSDCPECGFGVLVDEDGCCVHCGEDAMWYGLRWVVVGGESGHGARPFDLAWARSIVEQCKAAAVPVFVKQLGARPFQLRDEGDPQFIQEPFPIRSRKGGDPAEWPEDLRVREMPR